MLPAEIVSPGTQTSVVQGLICIGLTGLMIGVLHLFRKRLQLPWRQVAGLVIVTGFPVFAMVHGTAIKSFIVRGTATLHPFLSILLLIGAVAVIWIVFRQLSAFFRNPEFTRRRKLLTVGIALLMSCVAVPAGTMLAMMTFELQSQVWISPTVWPEARQVHVGAEELPSEMNLEDSKWLWAFMQWQAHLGAVIAPLIAVVLLLTWSSVRRTRRGEGGFLQILGCQKRQQIRLSGDIVVRSCVVASLVFLLLYLATTPRVAVVMDAYYREHYNRLADPSYLRGEVAEVKAQIRSDEKTLERLQAEIDERNRKLTEQRSREE
jgi:hypothetical protein